jgi:hypothetical protein
MVSFCRPWLQNLDEYLSQLLSLGMVMSYTTQFSHRPRREGEIHQTDETEFVTLFVPSSLASAPRMAELQTKTSDRTMLEAVDSLVDLIERHGMQIFPSAILPTPSVSSIEKELTSLRALRETYSTQLESRVQTQSIKEGPTSASSSKSHPQRASIVNRQDDLRRNKSRIRGELKELLQVLAGLLADHRNESLSEVIQEYKSR